MKYLTPALSCIAVVACISCSDNKEEDFAAETVALMAPRPALKNVTMAKENPGNVDRKLIRRASLEFEVTDIRKAYDSVKQLTTAARGYVADENHLQTNTQERQYLA